MRWWFSTFRSVWNAMMTEQFLSVVVLVCSQSQVGPWDFSRGGSQYRWRAIGFQGAIVRIDWRSTTASEGYVQRAGIEGRRMEHTDEKCALAAIRTILNINFSIFSYFFSRNFFIDVGRRGVVVGHKRGNQRTRTDRTSEIHWRHDRNWACFSCTWSQLS